MSLIALLLWVAIAWLALSALAVVGAIGKPRKPIEPRVAIVALIIQGAIIALLVVSALALA